ncbi:T9SS type A sorting domain-containing protein [Chitinophagales bacterium]|nr:T9SS type A sorting domain-containing protein [Chitinophagales bacterium]
MKKLFAFLISLFLVCSINAQELVDSSAFDQLQVYNSLWGLDYHNGKLYAGTDWSGEVFEISTDAEILSTIPTGLDFNHGLAFRDNEFVVVEDYTSSGSPLYWFDLNGNPTGSYVLPEGISGPASGVGGLHTDGNTLWFSVYYQDFDDYPYAYIYGMDMDSQEITDTVPCWGGQPMGITTKGDTLFYSMDDNDDDEEKIYAYSLSQKDTLFSLKLPDPDNDQSPRGLAWDGELLHLLVTRPGSSAFAYKMLYSYTVEPTPIIELPDSLAFGDVELGSADTLAFTISNSGDADLNITFFDIPFNVFFFVDEPDFPITIPPGETWTSDMVLTPADNFEYFFPMVIGSNAGTSTVILNGTGIVPLVPVLEIVDEENDNWELFMQDGEWSIIETTLDEIPQVTWVNTGTDIVAIDSVTIDNDGIIYQLLDGLETVPNLPIFVTPGDSVTFTFQIDGTTGHTLIIYSNSINGPFTLNLYPPLGIDSIQIENIVLYPNPASNDLVIRSVKPIAAIQIFNLTGQSVFEQSINNLLGIEHRISTSNIPDGTYILQVNNSIHKIIIQH